MKHRRLIYVALGSNLGDRAAMLARAVAAMNRAGLRVVRQSPIYETEPIGGPPQPWFLNAVAEVETERTAEEALSALQAIEQSFGRERLIPNGPRTLDLDLLLDGSRVVATESLQLPHPRLAERRFVLQPLADLVPGLMHPVRHKRIAQLLQELGGAGGRLRLWTPAGERGAGGSHR
jgi:2-amino-4-hydroxy-6-hydroxymethyldihydropteridine diphosphokinase